MPVTLHGCLERSPATGVAVADGGDEHAEAVRDAGTTERVVRDHVEVMQSRVALVEVGSSPPQQRGDDAVGPCTGPPADDPLRGCESRLVACVRAEHAQEPDR
jgi:hypothetical protein